MEPFAPPLAPPPVAPGSPPGQPDQQQLGAETLLATVGLHSFLTRDPGSDRRIQPIRLTQEVRDRATALPFRWRTAIRGFLRARDFEAPKSDRKGDNWSYERVADAILTEQTPESLAARIDLGDADLTLALAMAAGVALQAVRDVFPARGTQSLLGAEPSKPSDMELCRLRLVWDVVDDPGVVLTDLAAGRLSRRQVTAFRGAFPALATFVDKLVNTESVNLRAERPAFELERRRQGQLAVLMGLAAPDPTLATVLQANLRAPDAGVVPGQGPGKPAGPMHPQPLSHDKDKDMDQTATQEVAGG